MRISLQQANHLLQKGKIVAVPTETVYGLAASLNHPHAIDQIFLRKGRPSNNPLIVHLANSNHLNMYAHSLPADTEKLIAAFWPGPLTLVLQANRSLIPENVRAGLPTAAFRTPSHPLIQQLLESSGPLVMPSANLSGKPSATHWEHVEADFGKEFPVLDGGACQHGLESTILHHSQDNWQVIRVGTVTPEELLPVLGYLPQVVAPNEKSVPICPGQLYRHYAPKAQLHLCSSAVLCRGVVLGFPERVYPHATRMIPLGTLSNPSSVAEKLYAILRQLDEENISEASIDMELPSNGLWVTIAERLSRAARC